MELLVVIAIMFNMEAYGADFFALVKTGTPEKIPSAIDDGANVYAKDEDEKTPLHYAARRVRNFKVAVIAALVNAGADLEAKDKDQRTPLDYATSNPTANVVTALVKAKNAKQKNALK
jgi:ankyrin repeat protein